MHALIPLLFIFIAITTTLSFDHVVKEKLAEWGGYFDGEDLFSNAMSTAAAGPASIADIKEIPMIGIRLNLSPNWQQHRLASGYLYFSVNGNDKKLWKSGLIALEILE